MLYILIYMTFWQSKKRRHCYRHKIVVTKRFVITIREEMEETEIQIFDRISMELKGARYNK